MPPAWKARTASYRKRFYNSEAGHPIILQLYSAVGIHPGKGKDLDTKPLIGKRLSVEVSDQTYPDQATGAERSVRQATGFKAA